MPLLSCTYLSLKMRYSRVAIIIYLCRNPLLQPFTLGLDKLFWHYCNNLTGEVVDCCADGPHVEKNRYTRECNHPRPLVSQSSHRVIFLISKSELQICTKNILIIFLQPLNNMGINTEKQNFANMMKTKNSRPQERSLSNITFDST